jgi:sec-independent protein translocase protein TatA
MVGTSELILILLVALLLFGGKRLPELARSLGQALKEFKKATYPLSSSEQKEQKKDTKD